MTIEPEVFEAYYHRYDKQVRRELVGHGCRREDLDDISQTIWMEAWKSRERMKTQAFQKWLNVIVYRMALRHIKKESRRRDREVRYYDAGIEEIIY